MKKKILATLLATAMVVSMTACGAKTEDAAADTSAATTETTTETASTDEAIDYAAEEAKRELDDEIDDEYKVEGLEFVTQGLDLSEALCEETELPEIGTRLRIITMKGEPNYDGKEGEIIDIDDLGQLHGTWGGLAIIPEVDEFEVI